MEQVLENKKISVICPSCKQKKDIEIPESIINQPSQITTVSIPKGLVCNHHFQMFVDNNFKVRGYQRVDFELESKEITNKTKKENNVSNNNQDDEEMLKSLTFDSNEVIYNPKKEKKSNPHLKPKKMTLKEIYEEFWEFIEDDNEEFQEFIVKDNRREEFFKFNMNSNLIREQEWLM